jgi:hypothetical protein
VFNRQIAERTVIVDDSKLIIALVGVCGETVRSQRIGDGL